MYRVIIKETEKGIFFIDCQQEAPAGWTDQKDGWRTVEWTTAKTRERAEAIKDSYKKSYSRF
jgi:hypothetical protein